MFFFFFADGDGKKEKYELRSWSFFFSGTFCSRYAKEKKKKKRDSLSLFFTFPQNEAAPTIRKALRDNSQRK